MGMDGIFADLFCTMRFFLTTDVDFLTKIFRYLDAVNLMIVEETSGKPGPVH